MFDTVMLEITQLGCSVKRIWDQEPEEFREEQRRRYPWRSPRPQPETRRVRRERWGGNQGAIPEAGDQTHQGVKAART